MAQRSPLAEKGDPLFRLVDVSVGSPACDVAQKYRHQAEKGGPFSFLSCGQMLASEPSSPRIANVLERSAA